MRLHRWFAACSLLLGCTPDFDGPSRIKDLRVLAVVAEPSEILVDVGALATLDQLPTPAESLVLLQEVSATLPETFPTVTLRPLVVDPFGDGRPVHYQAVLCGNGTPSSDRGRGRTGGVRDTVAREACPPDSPVIAEGDATPPLVAADSPPDTPREIAVPVRVDFVPTREMVVAALTSDPLGAVFGLPLIVQFTFTAGEEKVVARKRVIFMPRLQPDQRPNQNPRLRSLTYETSGELAGSFNFDAPLRSPPSVRSRMTLTVGPEPFESYPIRILDRATGALETRTVDEETLRFSFFTAAGSFSSGTVSTRDEILRQDVPPDLSVRYNAPASLPVHGPLVSLWVVARDERGGSSFTRVVVRLSPR
jgi:hypothetical protein